MPKNDEQSLVGFRPVYGDAPATQEEMEACYVCMNCDEIRKDHMPDGACFFSPTMFTVKTIKYFTAQGGPMETEPEIRTRRPK